MQRVAQGGAGTAGGEACGRGAARRGSHVAGVADHHDATAPGPADAATISIAAGLRTAATAACVGRSITTVELCPCLA